MASIKLDKSIFQTNIIALSPKTFKVFIALLAACDDDGVARVSPTYLSRICYLSQKDTEKSLNTLSIPVGCGFTVFTIQPLEKNQYKISSKKYCDRFEIKKLTQYLKDAGFSHFEEK